MGDCAIAVRKHRRHSLVLTEAEAAKKYAPEPKNIVCFNDYAEIAENVVVQHIGGHSEGSSVVRVKDMVLCGDECYTRENLTLKKPTGSSFDLEKSTHFVQKYGVLEEKAILFHDLAVLSAIGNKVLLDEGEENK